MEFSNRLRYHDYNSSYWNYLNSWFDYNSSDRDFTREALFSLNIVGCPLLLTFMCVERCVAAVWPISYILLEKKQQRVAVCAAAWTLTATVALLKFWLHTAVVLSISVFISLLFLVMLLCRPGPGNGNAPFKKKALQNILVVMVPSVLAYCPLVAVVPFLSMIDQHSLTPAQCHVLHVLLLFPNFGLFIGPAFYLSRLKQLGCCRTVFDLLRSKTQYVFV